jgi:hypothetical protein
LKSNYPEAYDQVLEKNGIPELMKEKEIEIYEYPVILDEEEEEE